MRSRIAIDIHELWALWKRQLYCSSSFPADIVIRTTVVELTNRRSLMTGAAATAIASPARIMEVGMAFWPAKVLLSAIELQLFTELGSRSMTGDELQAALRLHPRANPDFFDTLVALRFLERGGDGPSAHYRNTAEAALFLDRRSPQFIGGFLEMANTRLYPFWGDLTEGLR